MAAELGLVQFRKVAGSPSVNEIPVDSVDAGTGLLFAGPGLDGTQGYYLSPTTQNAAQFRVRAGTASWEVWTAVRITGVGFSAVTDLFMFLDTFDAGGMGTLPSEVTGTYQIAADTGPIGVSGLYMRAVPGPIQLGLPALPLSSWLPNSAPGYGLPPSSSGWLLYAQGPGAQQEAADSTGFSPPEVLEMTPLNSSLPPADGDVYGRGILVSDAEPRYSNVAILNLVVASDAVLGTYNPVVVALEWNES